MKVLFVIGPLRKGGAERVVCNLSNELVKKNDVIIATTINSKSDYYLDKRIRVICLDDNKRYGFIKRNLERVKKLKKLINKEKVDVAIAFLPDSSYRLMLSKNNNVKTIISDRNDPNVEYNTFLKKVMTKYLYNKADGFVFQTLDASKWFTKSIQSRSTIIPNPINPHFICKPFEGIRDKTIVTVGRLTEQKNHVLLIDAFICFFRKHSDYKLLIYGEGPLREKLSAYIEKNNMEKNILLMGNIENVKDAIYKSGIFVMSSNYEGMPNALMEAMALGIPCISTDCPCGGPRFLINNMKNGVLFRVGDSKELVNSLNYLIEHPKETKKISQNANKICEDLNPQIINKKWEDYIIKILKKGS